MAEVRPFRGLRYQPRRVGDVGAVIAPPYDIISPQEQAALYDRSPYNVVRLEYGRSEPSDDDRNNRYTRAAAALAQWLRQGVLARDDRPCLYLYQQEFRLHREPVEPNGGRRGQRRALIVRVRLEEWERGVVRPHERTLAPPKEDRLRLLRACRAQVSPIFALYRDDAGAVGRLLAVAASGPPALDARDSAGHRHTLHLIADPDVQTSLQRLLAAATLYIADGHHRYETALAYRQERRAHAKAWSGDEPENFVMMGLTAVDDPGLVILPIHRLVRAGTPVGLLDQLGRRFRLERLPADDVEGLLARLAEAGRETTAFGLCCADGDGLYLLTLADRRAVGQIMPNDSPPAWRELDVNVLQYGVLEPVLGITADAIAGGGVVDFTEDAHEAVEQVRAGRYALAFLLNPTRPQQVLAVADADWRMPQKSTFFYPKMGTGLVINPLDG